MHRKPVKSEMTNSSLGKDEHHQNNSNFKRTLDYWKSSGDASASIGSEHYFSADLTWIL